MIRKLSILAGLAVATGVASAAFTGLQLRTDPTWNAAATAAINDTNSYRVVRMYAQFSNTNDAVVSVGQTGAGAFHLANNLSTFFQAVGGTNTSPNSGLFGPLPSVQWDTYVSVGRITNDSGDSTSPDASFAFVDVLPGAGQDTVNGGWFNSNPGNLQGRALQNGAIFETFLGQFTIKGLGFAPPTATSTLPSVAVGGVDTATLANSILAGEISVFQSIQGGGILTHTVTLTVPTPSGMALFGMVGLLGARRRRA